MHVRQDLSFSRNVLHHFQGAGGNITNFKLESERIHILYNVISVLAFGSGEFHTLQEVALSELHALLLKKTTKYSLPLYVYIRENNLT